MQCPCMNDDSSLGWCCLLQPLNLHLVHYHLHCFIPYLWCNIQFPLVICCILHEFRWKHFPSMLSMPPRSMLIPQAVYRHIWELSEHRNISRFSLRFYQWKSQVGLSFQYSSYHTIGCIVLCRSWFPYHYWTRNSHKHFSERSLPYSGARFDLKWVTH